MLAILERPAGRSVRQTVAASVRPPVSVRRPVPVRPLVPVRPVRPPATSPARVAPVVAAPGRPCPVPGPERRRLAEVGGPARRLRLTVRARRLVAGLVLICCAAVGGVAVDLLVAVTPPASTAISYPERHAPPQAGSSLPSGGLMPSSGAVTTVGSGDTLWSLAEQVDPGADPREVIAAIMALNGLSSPALQPGQVLRLP